MSKITKQNFDGETFEKVLNCIGEGVLLLSEDFRILKTNKFLPDSMGLTETDVIGKHCYRVTHRLKEPCTPPQRVCPVERVKKTGRPFTGAHVHFDRDGKKRHVEVIAHEIKDKDSGKSIFVHITKDLTDKKKLEERLRVEVAEKTGGLQKAYDEQKALDRMKDELISNVSHELRTPLTVYNSIIELVMDEDDRAERNKLLAMAKETVERQSKIIGDLVNAASVHKGDFELNLESVNLEQVITLVTKETEPVALSKGVSVRTSLSEELPTIKADISKLRHVFFDLLDNAIKFNKKEGTVTIEAVKRGRDIEVTISDTGIGIPEDHLDLIFDRFYQIDGSIRRKYGGVGLGLAVAKDIIRWHGGNIWVESEPKKGSRFMFILPISGSTRFSKSALPDEFKKRFPSITKGKKKR